MKGHAQLGERPLDERRLHDDARQSDVARRLHIDLVKSGRQIVSAVARTKFTESLRVGDREFLVRAKSLDRIANFLGLRHTHRSRADLGNHADDAIVAGSAVDGVHHVAQCLFFRQHQARCRRVRRVLQERLLEIRFENGLGRNFPLRADHSHQHDDHCDQPQSAQDGKETYD